MRVSPLVLALTAVVLGGVALQMPAAAAPLPVAPLASQSADPLMIEAQHRFGGRGGRVYVGPRVGRPIGV